MRAIVVLAFVAASAYFDHPAQAGVFQLDPCRLAAADSRAARRALHRMRAARAGRPVASAGALAVEAVDPSPVGDPPTLEALSTAAPQVPEHETEVWPQAWALFPSE